MHGLSTTTAIVRWLARAGGSATSTAEEDSVSSMQELGDTFQLPSLAKARTQLWSAGNYCPLHFASWQAHWHS